MARPVPPFKDPGSKGSGSESNAQRHESVNLPSSETASAGLEPSLVALSTTKDRQKSPQLPFAWQHDRRLLLLDGSADGWMVAELRFDPRSCRYVELQRSTFLWQREAAGALLAKIVGSGESVVEETARSLNRWLVANATRSPRKDAASEA